MVSTADESVYSYMPCELNMSRRLFLKSIGSYISFDCVVQYTSLVEGEIVRRIRNPSSSSAAEKVRGGRETTWERTEREGEERGIEMS